MKLREILLLSGASLFLAVSIPSGPALAQADATQQDQDKGQKDKGDSKGEKSKSDEGATQQDKGQAGKGEKSEKGKGDEGAAPQDMGKGDTGRGEMGRGDGKGRMNRGEAEISIPMAPAEEMRAERMPPGMSQPEQSVPCPHPYSQTQNATNPANRDSTDFNGWNYSWASGLGDPSHNVVFGYTFKLNIPSDRLCCEITKAVLTLRLKCHGDIPENDTWAIIHNGHGVVGAGGSIGWPRFCDRQTKTVSYVASSAVLNMMNQGHRLSFSVQDDTTVLSATLTTSGCCVLKH
jgi:hypothetical protein